MTGYKGDASWTMRCAQKTLRGCGLKCANETANIGTEFEKKGELIRTVEIIFDQGVW